MLPATLRQEFAYFQAEISSSGIPTKDGVMRFIRKSISTLFGAEILSEIQVELVRLSGTSLTMKCNASGATSLEASLVVPVQDPQITGIRITNIAQSLQSLQHNSRDFFPPLE